MRNNDILDALFEAMQSAALAPTHEALGMVVAGSHSRPANILLPKWRNGRPATLDIYVISPLQDLTLYAAASTPGQALHECGHAVQAGGPPV